MRSNKVETKKENSINKAALITFIISLLITGTNGVLASRISLPSYQLTLLRALFGLLFLLGITIISKHKLKIREYPKEIALLCLSGVAMGGQWMFTFEAYNQIGVGISTLLLYCAPIVVILLSPLFFKETITMIKLLGIVIVFLGLLLINMNDSDNQLNAFGVICGVVSAILLATCIISNKKVVHITGLDNTIIVLISASIVIALFVGIKSGYSMSVVASDWGWILLLGFGSAGIGNYLYFSSISKLPAQTVCLCGYVDPLSAIFFSSIFLGEKMMGIQLMGAICIMGGALFAELSGTLKQKYKEIKIEEANS